jgi:tripartite-type tricarboxylate transporter receptor subunit TctC
MSRPFARLGLIAVVGAAGLLLPALPARSADVYAGKTIDIIVGSAPGGGYDIYSRTIARHMAAHIPGNPAIIVKNMPGAGSGRTAQFIASIAPKDGTVIGAVFPGAIINPLLDEHTSVKYQPVDFAYLGTADNGTRICATYANSKIKTFADARARKAVVGASAAGGSTKDYALMLNHTAGAKFDVVTGYKGSLDITLAAERGEVDGLCGWDWSSVKSQKSDWLRDHKLNLLVQVSLEPEAELTKLGVPPVWQFIPDADDRKAVELVVGQQVFQRPYIAPPGTSADRVEILRSAFMATMHDPAFLADAEKTRIDVAPLPGAKVQDTVARLYATPSAIVARARRIIKP